MTNQQMELGFGGVRLVASRRERRMTRDIGQHPQPDLEAVLHDDRIDEAQIDARAGVQGSA